MKILVVGGAGYIGSVCTELLLDEGHSVAVFDNLSEGHRAAIDSRADFFGGDLAELEKIRSTLAAFEPDAVMHFAASALVGESMQDPSKYFRNNIGHGLNLLDAMIATGANRLVFSSTCAIFGPPERLPIDETLSKQPINPYGESKLAFEKILRWYGEIHGLRFVSLATSMRPVPRKIRRTTSRRNSHSQCPAGRPRQKPHTLTFSARLRYAGRHLHPRLHPHSRSVAGPHPGVDAKSEFYNLTGGGTSVREALMPAENYRHKVPLWRNRAGRRSAAPHRGVGKSSVNSAGSQSFRISMPSSSAWKWHQVPGRLRRLTRLLQIEAPAETRSAGAEFVESTAAPLGRVVVVVVVSVVGHRLGQRDLRTIIDRLHGVFNPC